MPDRYRLAAPIYDAATLVWSGGAIWRTQARALECIKAGDRVMIPGAGTARLAVEAAALGANVLAVDRSASMMRRARARLERNRGRVGDRLELREAELDSVPARAEFDVVVAAHFLNVFRPDVMPGVRAQLMGHVAPGGRLVVADFAPLLSGRSVARAVARGVQRMHHVIPLGGCALLTKNAMHKIYDHGADLADAMDVDGVAIHDEQSFLAGPRWFRTWVFRKNGDR